MSEKKRSLMAVFVALMVIIVGLLMLCSQRAAVNQGQDLASDDEAFRKELLEMLDLADESGTDDGTLAEFQTEDMSQSETAEDVLSLLAPKSAAPVPATPIEAEMTPREKSETMGLTPEMFNSVRNDISRLEGILEAKSHAVDSLKRIVENKNARIRELEARLSSGVRPANVATRPTTTASRPAPATASAAGFMAAYQNARQLFESYNYDAAIAAFEQLLQQYPSHELADNCQYWIGESYYGLRQYEKAILEFQKVFTYSQNDKHDDAQLMIGLAYVKQGMRDRANREFTTFLNTYAGSEYTAIARRYQQNI